MAAHGWPFCLPPPAMRRLWRYETNTENTQLTVTSNASWGTQKKEATGDARRLLQYRQLPDTSSLDGVFGIFRATLKFVFIYSTMFSRTLCFREILFGEIWIQVTQQILSLVWNPTVYNNPVRNPIPNQKPQSTPPFFFLNVIYMFSFRLCVWCERYTSFWFRTVTNPSLAAYIFLPSAHCNSEKPTRRGEGGSRSESALSSYASNTLLQIEHF